MADDTTQDDKAADDTGKAAVDPPVLDPDNLGPVPGKGQFTTEEDSGATKATRTTKKAG